MAKHLTKDDVSAIVHIINGWVDNKLTWKEICQSASLIIGKTPTRQSLNSNLTIKKAYSVKKTGIKIHGPRISMPSSLKVASARINKQQNEIDLLKAKNALLLEQFVKWQYNSYKFGLKEHQLNEQLPRIDRERTDGK